LILIAIGSNLAAPGFASPRDTAESAVAELPTIGVDVVARSPWYLSEPVPASDQPWFVNGVVAVATDLPPEALLGRLLALETRFGRARGARNAARSLDLDLLDYDGHQCATATLVLPHPRLHQRRFVLVPLRDIAPEWRHPALGMTVAELVARLPSGQPVHPLGRGDPPGRSDCG
jgi:2-amino-4-hydroxy-6-hydroxymethyldihydropteridine diphosphokinase